MQPHTVGVYRLRGFPVRFYVIELLMPAIAAVDVMLC